MKRGGLNLLFVIALIVAFGFVSAAANFNIRNGSDTTQSFFFVNESSGNVGIWE